MAFFSLVNEDLLQLRRLVGSTALHPHPTVRLRLPDSDSGSDSDSDSSSDCSSDSEFGNDSDASCDGECGRTCDQCIFFTTEPTDPPGRFVIPETLLKETNEPSEPKTDPFAAHRVPSRSPGSIGGLPSSDAARFFGMFTTARRVMMDFLPVADLCRIAFVSSSLARAVAASTDQLHRIRCRSVQVFGKGGDDACEETYCFRPFRLAGVCVESLQLDPVLRKILATKRRWSARMKNKQLAGKAPRWKLIVGKPRPSKIRFADPHLRCPPSDSQLRCPTPPCPLLLGEKLHVAGIVAGLVTEDEMPNANIRLGVLTWLGERLDPGEMSIILNILVDAEWGSESPTILPGDRGQRSCQCAAKGGAGTPSEAKGAAKGDGGGGGEENGPNSLLASLRAAFPRGLHTKLAPSLTDALYRMITVHPPAVLRWAVEEAGARVDDNDCFGPFSNVRTFFMSVVAQRKDLEILDILLRHRSRLLPSGELSATHVTTVTCSVFSGHPGLLRLLRDHGVLDVEKAIRSAIDSKNMGWLEYLAELVPSPPASAVRSAIERSEERADVRHFRNNEYELSVAAATRFDVVAALESDVGCRMLDILCRNDPRRRASEEVRFDFCARVIQVASLLPPLVRHDGFLMLRTLYGITSHTLQWKAAVEDGHPGYLTPDLVLSLRPEDLESHMATAAMAVKVALDSSRKLRSRVMLTPNTAARWMATLLRYPLFTWEHVWLARELLREGCPTGKSLALMVARRGSAELMQDLINSGCTMDREACIEIAKKKNHKRCLALLMPRGRVHSGEKTSIWDVEEID